MIHAVDHFVVYDDVQFIKRGWINRNRISSKGKDTLFTVPVQGKTQQARICDVTNAADDKWLRKFGMQLQHEYGKAPHFAEVRDLVLGSFEEARSLPVSELAVISIAAAMKRLNLPFDPVRSSVSFPETVDLKRADRLIAITRILGGKRYVNLPGGMTLYGTEQFAAQRIDLRFIFEQSQTYKQFNHLFIPKLSIIDVLMHNDPASVREMLNQYELLTAEDVAARNMSPSSDED